jgi:hypothetical protein
MSRRLAALLVLVLVFAPLAAGAARPPVPPVSAPGDFAADAGWDLPVACRRPASTSTSILGGVVASARGSSACSTAMPRSDIGSALAGRAAPSNPRALLSARFHRKQLGPRTNAGDPPFAL